MRNTDANRTQKRLCEICFAQNCMFVENPFSSFFATKILIIASGAGEHQSSPHRSTNNGRTTPNCCHPLGGAATPFGVVPPLRGCCHPLPGHRNLQRSARGARALAVAAAARDRFSNRKQRCAKGANSRIHQSTRKRTKNALENTAWQRRKKTSFYL